MSPRSSLQFESPPIVPAGLFLLAIVFGNGLPWLVGQASVGTSTLVVFGFLVGGLVFTMIALAGIRIDGPGLEALAPDQTSTGRAIGATLGLWLLGTVLVVVVGIVLDWRLSLGAPLAAPTEYWPLFAVFLATVALPEELLFRGYLQNRIVATVRGDEHRHRLEGALTIAATAYGLYILSFELSAVLEWGARTVLFGSLLSFLVMGVVWTIAYELTRSLPFVILAHALFNASLTLGTGFLVDAEGRGIILDATTEIGSVESFGIVIYAIATIVAAFSYRQWSLQFDHGEERRRVTTPTTTN